MGRILLENIKGPAGEDGEQGPPGPNTIPTAEFIASELANPETASNNAVATMITDALGSFEPADVLTIVQHAANASYARPPVEGRVAWIGTVVPTNRISGDIVFIADETPIPEDTILVSDDFNRADGALGSTPVGAKAWTPAGTGAAAAVVSNRLSFTALTSGAGYVFFDAGQANGRFVGKLGSISTGHIGGFVFRYIDTNNQILLSARVSGSDFHYRLQKRVAGTVTVIQDLDVVSSAGDIIRLDMTGTTLALFINGVQKWTGTVTELASATKFGCYMSGTDFGTTYDDVAFIIPA